MSSKKARRRRAFDQRQAKRDAQQKELARRRCPKCGAGVRFIGNRNACLCGWLGPVVGKGCCLLPRGR